MRRTNSNPEERKTPSSPGRSLNALPWKFSWRTALIIFGLAAAPALVQLARLALTTPDRVSILWRSEGTLAAGAPYSPFLMVRDTSTRRPIPGVIVRASVVSRGRNPVSRPMGEAMSDAGGTVGWPAWRIPDVKPGEYTLVMEATSSWGNVIDRAERDVVVTKAARLAVATDRAQARPGEKIRVRSLLVSEADGKPIAKESVSFKLTDPEGNRIAAASPETSRFGLAWAVFPLDDQAREGVYTIEAESGGMDASVTVNVKQYRLPAFRLGVSLDRTWYGPQDHIKGSVTAATFDGRPIGEAKGEVELMQDDGEPAGSGVFRIDASAPSGFNIRPVVSDILLESEMVTLRLVVSLTDAAGRRVTKTIPVPVSRGPLSATAVAESGDLVQGVENKVYLVVRRPDNSPVAGPIIVERKGSEESEKLLELDEHGVVSFTLSSAKHPSEVIAVRLPGSRPESAQLLSVPVRPMSRERSSVFGGLLLRTESAVVAAGSGLDVSIESSCDGGSAVVALRQDGRPVSTCSVPISGNKGAATLRVPEGVSGLLTVDAMLCIDDGDMWTDARVVSVIGSANLRLSASPDSPAYRPGDTATVEFRVTDADGRGVPAAVSVVAVDEALLALTGDRPGLAQAIYAAGMRIPQPADFPISAGEFGEQEGDTAAATAALASIRPPTHKRGSIDELVRQNLVSRRNAEWLQRVLLHPQTEYDRELGRRMRMHYEECGMWADISAILGIDDGPEGEILKDTAPGKIASSRARRHQLTGTLYGLVMAWLAFSVVLVIVWLAWNPKASGTFTAVNKALNAVSTITIAVWIVGLLGVLIAIDNFRSEFAILAYIAALGVMLVVGHALALVRASSLDREHGDNADRINNAIAATVIADFIAVGLIAVMLWDPSEGALALLTLMLLLAAIIEHAVSQPKNRTGVHPIATFLGVVVTIAVIAAIAVPNLCQSRIASNETSLMATATVLQSGQAVLNKMSRPIDETPSPASIRPRLRFDFPETLVFAPQIITDPSGRATLNVPVADSLTSWSLHADAVAAAGGTTWTKTSLVVTQPFSVDVALPTDVTAGDTLFVPVVVTNNTAAAKTVNVKMQAAGARMVGRSTSTLEVAAKTAANTEFEILFAAAGTARLRVTGSAGDEADAIEMKLPVVPDGRPVGFSASAMISEGGTLSLDVPEDALPATINAQLRIHRGALSQVIDGLDGMLREPHGCFEQTSSSTYPNVLILRYLRETGHNEPEIEKRARDYIARGYQRLLGFEVGDRSGGFSLYGRAPASPWLTAYGLMEFTDMSKVHDVDPELLTRIKAWLRAHVGSDGSFPTKRHGWGAEGKIAATAYAVWGLGKDAPLQSVSFLRNHIPQIKGNAYLSALVANALARTERASAALLADGLRSLADVRRINGTQSATLDASRTFAWGYGQTARAETTAIGILALLATGRDMSLADSLLTSLQANAGGYGWGSTHATILSLKALVGVSATARSAGPGRIVIEVNGSPLTPLDLPAEESATPLSMPIDVRPGASRIALHSSGGAVAARVSGDAYVPWGNEEVRHRSPLQASVDFNTLQLPRDALVLGVLTLKANGRRCEVPMVEWGLPAGFVPEPADLDGLTANGKVSHWEVSGRSLRLYLPDLETGQAVDLPVRFRATAKGSITCKAGKVYEYYRRDESTAIAPQKFKVY